MINNYRTEGRKYINDFPFQDWIDGWVSDKNVLAEKVVTGAKVFFVNAFDQQKYGSETGEGYIEWQPLAESTLTWKAKHGYGSTPLVNKGILRAALMECDKGRTYDDMYLSIEGVEYARYQNEGGDKDINHPPARPFFNNSYELNREIRKIVESHIDFVFNSKEYVQQNSKNISMIGRLMR